MEHEFVFCAAVHGDGIGVRVLVDGVRLADEGQLNLTVRDGEAVPLTLTASKAER